MKLRVTMLATLLLGTLTAIVNAQGSSFPAPPPSQLAAVNAANFQSPVPLNGIVALFNTSGSRPLADFTFFSHVQPLSTDLGGTQVLVEGVAQPLFFVSPGQINFQLLDLPTGTTAVNVDVRTRGETRGFGVIQVAPNPGIFTLNMQGTGLPAALTTFDGLTYASVATGAGAPIPIVTQSNDGRPNFLVLFGTGFSAGTTTATINGLAVPVTFAGPQGGFAGLQQINLRLIPDLKGAGAGSPVNVLVRNNNVAANVVQVVFSQ
jgi:uncharacterized protein (TIGR03437 family)